MNSKKLLSKITVGLLTVSVGAATFANPVENVELVDGGIGQAVSNGEEEIVEEAEEVKENVELSEAVVDEGAQQVAEEESADAEMQISFLAETEESSTESQTDNLTKDQVIITNNAKGTDDTIVVNGIQAGAEVKVYNSATATTPLKTAVVANGSTSVTISIAQLGQDPGVVYISITEEGQLESEKLEFEYSSEPKTDAIDESQVEINNNANAKDTVTVTGLAEGDIVKVYSTEDKILGTATVEAGKTEAVVTIAQLGEEATTVKVSLTSKDKLESDKLEVEVAGEETTEALAADKVVIVNNVTGTKDTVTVSGLAAGTILKVYAAEEDTKAVGTATAVEDKDTVINLAQLGVTEGSVYVTVTAPNEKESAKVKVAFEAEAVTDTLKAEQVKVANNANAKDTVTVTDLAAGDIVKVYGAEDKVLGTATVGTGKTEAVVSIAQLGEEATTVKVSLTSKDKLESDKLEVEVAGEETTEALAADKVVIVNNVTGTKDTVTVSGLAAGTILKVYAAEEDTKAVGTATAVEDKDTVINLAQLGVTEGSVYVTVTAPNEKESAKVKVAFEAEAVTDTLKAEQVKVANNANAKDTVTVTDLAAGDIVKVYGAEDKVLGTATVGTGKTEAVVSIAQLGEEATTVKVSLTSKEKLESEKLEVEVAGEKTTEALAADKVVVVNNVTGKKDTVTVSGLAAGTILKVYAAEEDTKAVGTATAVEDKDTVINLAQLGVTEGSVYVTVTAPNEKESAKVKVAFEAEAVTDTLKAEQVKVANNANAKDTVTVTDLAAGDIVKVYGAEDKVLGTATVGTGKTEAVVSIAQLGEEATTVKVSLTSKEKLESEKLEVEVAGEKTTEALAADKVVVVNNVTGTKDTVTVSGLAAGTILKVYAAEEDTKAVGTATAVEDKDTVINLAQLGVTEGSVYVTVTAPNEKESAKVKVAFEAEAVTDTLKAEQVKVANNANAKDTVTVTDLVAGDIVKVYSAEDKVLGTATVGTGKTEAVVSIAQLGEEATTVKVSLTSKDKLESDKLEIEVAGEETTEALAADKVVIVNNVTGTKDTVTVSGLAAGTILKVYAAEEDTKAVGTATAVEDKDTVINLAQLGVTEGSVYVTVTAPNEKESAKVKVAFEAEAVTDTLKAEQVKVANNANAKDTVTVTDLAAGDIVKVYGAEDKVLGTATVGTGKTEAVVSIAQLGEEATTVKVSLTSKEKLESEKLEVEVAGEKTTEALAADKVVVVNNVTGTKDTVTVSGLAAGTILKVYAAEEDTKAVGTATAVEDKDTVINLAQLGVTEGSVYVTVTAPNEKESAKLKVAFEAEAVTDTLKAEQVKVANNANAKDTVTVTDLAAGDIVKVYGAEDKVLGTATVGTGKTEAVVSIAQLGEEATTVKVSLTSKEKLESEKLEVEVAGEKTTEALATDAVAIVNNVTGTKDTVTVSGLAAGTILKVYAAEEDTKAVGTATAVEDKDTVISLAQLGVTEGSVYVTVTAPNEKESTKVKVDFKAEAVTDTLKAEQVKVANNANAKDTVTVTDLAVGDIVKVYGAEDQLLGKATVGTGKTEAVVSIAQLGETVGEVYITNTTKGALESEYFVASYKAEAKSAGVEKDKVVIINNIGTDAIFIYGLKEGTVVNVYNAETEGSIIAKATVAANQSQVYITVQQLGAESGSVYISLTEVGSLEGDRAEISFEKEIEE